ncbi:MAG: hypothetical protein ACOCVG_02430 [Verrucomicrobiota bacterium]
MSFWKWISLGLMIAGLVMFSAGMFAKSNATPMGAMDCGCGGGQECVTKNKAVSMGSGVTVAGGVLFGLGLIGGGASLALRQRAAGRVS